MAINENLFRHADKPERTKGDEGEVKERSIDELIKLDRHLAANCTNNGPLPAPWGLQFAVARPHGTVPRGTCG